MAGHFTRERSVPGPQTSDEAVTLATHSGRRFLLHARPLAHFSEFIRTRLNRKLQGVRHVQISLREEYNESIIEFFTYWVYSKSFYWQHNVSDLSLLGIDSVASMGLASLAKAWLFGNYILAPEFQNCAMKLMLLQAGRSIGEWPVLLKEVTPLVPQDSHLETFLADLFCHDLFDLNRFGPVSFSRLSRGLLKAVSERMGVVSSHEPYSWKMRTIEAYTMGDTTQDCETDSSSPSTGASV